MARKWSMAGIALAAATAFAAPAVAQTLTGVTDTEIHIGQWGPQTGPAAPGAPWRAAPACCSR